MRLWSFWGMDITFKRGQPKKNKVVMKKKDIIANKNIIYLPFAE